MKNNSGKFPEILGYISQPERVALQRCVLETSHVPGDAIEIGSLNGLSALLIYSVLANDKKLVCIEKGQTETLNENLVKYCTAQPPRTESWAIFNQDFKDVDFSNWLFSFCFVDHDHTYENNAVAFQKFWPLIPSGGIFAFHDFGHPDFKDGTRAIQQLIEQYNLKIHSRAGGFIAFKKP